MAGFDAAVEKLNNLNKQLQEKSARDRKVAELHAMATTMLALKEPAGPDFARAGETWLKTQQRVVQLVKELTTS